MQIELVYCLHPEAASGLLPLIETIVAEDRLPAIVTLREVEDLEYSISTAVRVCGPAGEELTMPLYSHIFSRQDLDLIREFIFSVWKEYTLVPILHVHGEAKIAA